VWLLCDEDNEELQADLNTSNTNLLFNNLFLVLNSSIKFIINCAVRKSFRHNILRILRCGYVKGACGYCLMKMMKKWRWILESNASNTSQVINHLFFVLYSSINFIIFCAVR
jgi:hypothetical protein